MLQSTAPTVRFYKTIESARITLCIYILSEYIHPSGTEAPATRPCGEIVFHAVRNKGRNAAESVIGRLLIPPLPSHTRPQSFYSRLKESELKPLTLAHFALEIVRPRMLLSAALPPPTPLPLWQPSISIGKPKCGLIERGIAGPSFCRSVHLQIGAVSVPRGVRYASVRAPHAIHWISASARARAGAGARVADRARVSELRAPRSSPGTTTHVLLGRPLSTIQAPSRLFGFCVVASQNTHSFCPNIYMHCRQTSKESTGLPPRGHVVLNAGRLLNQRPPARGGGGAAFRADACDIADKVASRPRSGAAPSNPLTVRLNQVFIVLANSIRRGRAFYHYVVVVNEPNHNLLNDASSVESRRRPPAPIAHPQLSYPFTSPETSPERFTFETK
ncbi:hypothetical protein EVAR_59637_1 [Eumeta japonica]|uniref:Uncharacterized protein n=1 Tax=Eumeta variegata TaxID=151549 RepID=A0A4C1YIV8_EUMVA|nr:hypothetical protein EVAR_59637_1 [Eumeta japonica]